jgi:hypothetical protein
MHGALPVLIFGACAIAVFRCCAPATAAIAVYLAGLVVLPVGTFPPGSTGSDFPYWITGSAVPSDMLVTKAWIAPLVALAGLVAFDHRRLMRLRLAWIDLPMALWCAWPLLQALVVREARPAGAIATLYLCGVWGLPWILGRACMAAADGQLVFVRGLVVAGLACLPFSLIEGIGGPTLYGRLYGVDHPFRFDGAGRYIGYRPIGFFEHGTQFGLWLALCALAAIWLARSEPPGPHARRDRIAAATLVAMTLAAQSVAAIVWLAVGSGFLLVSRWLAPRRVAAIAAGALLLCGAVYLSGAVPIQRWAATTALGREAVAGFKAVGRGSFTWRIAQDQRLLPAAVQDAPTGSARWDWWTAGNGRPWGLPLQVLGQFGIVGLASALAIGLWPACRAASGVPDGSPWQRANVALLLATIVALSILDSLMNAFVFLPAIAIAGGLAADDARTARR